MIFSKGLTLSKSYASIERYTFFIYITLNIIFLFIKIQLQKYDDYMTLSLKEKNLEKFHRIFKKEMENLTTLIERIRKKMRE